MEDCAARIPPGLEDVEHRIPNVAWLTWAAAYTVVAMFFLVWFMVRAKQRKQPILAREPNFVFTSTLAGVLWTAELCGQRIWNKDYSCWLTLWSGYLGVVLILNVYMLRAFFLYTKFSLTKDAILERQAQLGGDLKRVKTVPVSHEATLLPPNERKSRQSVAATSLSVAANYERGRERRSARASCFKRRRRFYMSRCFVIPLQVVVAIVLCIYPAVSTSSNACMREYRGDGCTLTWKGDATVLATYAGFCACCFIACGWALRGKLDAFWIKQELWYVGATAVPVIIAWFVLNNLNELAKLNKEMSLSTILLLFMVAFAFAAGVLWPLYRSYYDPPELDIETPESISTCAKLLESDKGRQAFEKHLRSEFAVQHLYFWEDVERLKNRAERYRSEHDSNGISPERLGEIAKTAKELFLQYMLDDVEQVHPPVNIGRKLLRPIENVQFKIKACENSADVDVEGAVALLNEILEVYTAAQKDVFKMLRGSYRGFKRSCPYEELVKKLTDNVEFLEALQ